MFHIRTAINTTLPPLSTLTSPIGQESREHINQSAAHVAACHGDWTAQRRAEEVAALEILDLLTNGGILRP